MHEEYAKSEWGCSGFISRSKYAEWRANSAKGEAEKLDWLAGNPFYTRRFFLFVGRKCRSMTIKDVAEELNLDWHTVKDLDKEYMKEQLRRAGVPAPTAIGIDEVSIRKGHSYALS